jgi:hypothetical protein
MTGQEDLAMRDIPGWVAGAVGVGVLVGAFYLGGRTGAAAAAPNAPDTAAFAATTAAAPMPEALMVACEPGQRAVIAAAGTAGAPRVSCMSDARPVAGTYTVPGFTPMGSQSEVLTVSDVSYRPAAQPAVITQPVEVYRPRSRPVSRGEAAPPKRSWERSAVIIGSSAAIGATVGGLAKGKKGAVIGGIVGGGAATVWDQVTRRRAGDLR